MDKSRFWITIIGGGFSLISLGGVAIAYEHLRGVAYAAGQEAAKIEIAPLDAGEKGHEARISTLEQQVVQTRQDVHEARGELRDLYRAVMENKRSERLEHPVPPMDGGPR